MTEQEYEKLVSDAAFTELYKFTAGGTSYEEDHFIKGFLAGVKWARENPGPEVQELIEGLDILEASRVWMDNKFPQHTDAALGGGLREVLKSFARFKERTAGKGEGK